MRRRLVLFMRLGQTYNVITDEILSPTDRSCHRRYVITYSVPWNDLWLFIGDKIRGDQKYVVSE
jgi:hypothetical protein